MTIDKERYSAIIPVLRWSARILGVIIAGFLLLMFFGYFLEGRGPSFDSLEPFAAIGLMLMGIYIFGLFSALRWERAGSFLAAMVLGGFFAIMFLGLLPGNVSGGFSTRGVLNPVFLALWLPPLLFFVCRWLEDRKTG